MFRIASRIALVAMPLIIGCEPAEEEMPPAPTPPPQAQLDASKGQYVVGDEAMPPPEGIEIPD